MVPTKKNTQTKKRSCYERLKISGKSSKSSNEDRLVIHSSKGSSDYEGKVASSNHASRYASRGAAGRLQIDKTCKKQRKVGFFPLNPTSENLRKAVTVDQDGDYVWKEDPRDRILCPHCGYIINEHDRQVINFPCWHRMLNANAVSNASTGTR